MAKFKMQFKAIRAFSLIEILAALSLLLILVAIIFPFARGGIARAQQVTCQSNLRQLGVAYYLHAIENNERFPGNFDQSIVVDDPFEITTIGTYGRYNAPDALLRGGYLPNLEAFFSPTQELYTYPDATTPTGRSGWAREGFFVGYIFFTLRDYTIHGSPNSYGNLRNATLQDNPGVPLVMNFFPGFLSVERPLHGPYINVLRVDGSVTSVRWQPVSELGSWRQRVDYLARLHTPGG